MTLKGQGQNLTPGLGHVMTEIGHVAYQSIRLDEENNEAIPSVMSRLNEELLIKAVCGLQ